MDNAISIKVTPSLFINLDKDTLDIIAPDRALTEDEKNKYEIGLQVLKNYQYQLLTEELIGKMEGEISAAISMDRWYSRKC